MLSQNQRNSSYRSLFISLTHALRPPLGVPRDGSNKTSETTPHQQSRISGCLKFLPETCHKIHFGPYLYIELCFFKMLFENMIGPCVHWNVCCLADSAFSTHIPPGSDTAGVLSIAWGFASVDWYFLPPEQGQLWLSSVNLGHWYYFLSRVWVFFCHFYFFNKENKTLLIATYEYGASTSY